MEVRHVPNSLFCRICFIPIVPSFQKKLLNTCVSINWSRSNFAVNAIQSRNSCALLRNDTAWIHSTNAPMSRLSYMQKEFVSCKSYFHWNQTGQLHVTRIVGTSELLLQSLQTMQKTSYCRSNLETRCLGLLDSLNFQRKVLLIHFPKLTSIRQSKNRCPRICSSSVSTVSTDDPGRSSKSVDGSNGVCLELRQAKPEELVAVAEIRRVAFTPEETFSTHLTEDKRQQDIYYAILERLKRPGTCCLVVVKRILTDNENGQSVDKTRELDIPEEELVLGTCDVSIHDAESGLRVRTSNFKRVVYVSSMAVRPEYRRKGVAKRLLNGVLDIARLEKIDDIFLHVDETNAPAVRLYYSFGFQRFPLPIPMWLRTMARHDHVLLWKDLRRAEE
ncbi:hypothetical protein GpartN1_g1713.t1 [Galdieria partita]|uniref:N-acetyltransferase domain-containing protein n=1 Tax=Galdieria partita TaxID=83374 RepID=A0A9C7UNX6_9RHOD|nr:hypothetical protein GpartN1_g1713.t1 [Galdieria partita]